MTTTHQEDPRMIELPRRQTWMTEANCIGEDPTLFFPQRGGDWRTPLTICQPCTVQTPCLEWALDQGEKAGIYGGTSERERRRIRKTRRLADLKAERRTA